MALTRFLCSGLESARISSNKPTQKALQLSTGQSPIHPILKKGLGMETDGMFHANGPTFWELAVQALSSTERGYDLLAPKFDYTPFRTPDFILSRVREHLQTLSPIAAGLDICCGT